MIAALLLLAATQVAVLSRTVERGTVLSVDDFVLEPRDRVVGRPLDPAAVAGLEAVRPLASGRILLETDLAPPRLVRRGETVTLTVRHGNMVITAPGRALADGRRGTLVRVVSGTTNRTLEGIVDSPGRVRLAAPF